MTNITLIRYGCCLLAAIGAATLTHGLASVALPATPRLGRRGARRRRALEAGGVFGVAEPLLRFIAGVLTHLNLPALRARNERELRRAGYCLGLTPDEYSALCLLSAMLLGTTIGGLSYAAGRTWVLAIPAALFGLVLPHIQVREVAAGRAKAIARGLPHAIQVAAMCMGAGHDFPGSIRQLASQSSIEGEDVLADEFAAILEELDLGHTRSEALRSFAERVPTDAVRDFVNAVIQAEQKGNPLARVLQVQGRMLNMRRSVMAEEAAARAGVLMIVPMVFLVGCILLLLMGPFLVRGFGL